LVDRRLGVDPRNFPEDRRGYIILCYIRDLKHKAHRLHEAYQFSLCGPETDLTLIIEYDPPQH
jgi:hypothetical protein